MKNAINEFIDLVESSLEYDPWTEQRGFFGYCEEIEIESKEVIDALKKKDIENLKEELGDVFIDWCHAVISGEREGYFSAKDVVNDAIDKLNRRKPYLKEKRKVSLNEAREIWDKVKIEEKRMKD
jgi:NTP pyrophosphatase (non-canonical NTP hydrolase)